MSSSIPSSTAEASGPPHNVASPPPASNGAQRPKLFGRAFYESLGSPKVILAPMVDQSEFAWRMLTRSFLPPDRRSNLLAYSPMLHSRMFLDAPKYRDCHFEPLKRPLSTPSNSDSECKHAESDLHLDGNPTNDRPLFVQFCSNVPEDFLNAARYVEPFCDAVDLNLGCPQGIARRGNYGAFLQEDWDLIYKLINKLHKELHVPVTAKFRIQETKEKTLEYAKMILSAGASIITVHGRRREQKGHYTGLADWSFVRYLRGNLPPDTVIFANGNILRHEDIEQCLQETGADGVMSAEGNLYDPSIFAEPPAVGQEEREYWRGKDGKGGYRMDAVMRRYMDIIHKYVLGQEPPLRKPLFLPSDPVKSTVVTEVNGHPAPSAANGEADDPDEPPRKKRKSDGSKKQEKATSPNLIPMQAHLFHMLRSLVKERHGVRDALARCRAGDIPAFEHVLRLVEEAVKEGLLEYESNPSAFEVPEVEPLEENVEESSVATVAMCKRPWFICQPYVRPLPKEAIEKGSIQLSKRDKAKLEEEKKKQRAKEAQLVKEAGLQPEGKVEAEQLPDGNEVEIPKEGLVCG